MRRHRLSPALLPALALCMLLSACDRYDRPNLPVPESFSARTLEGRGLERAGLLGKPWVVSIWAPG
nr:hypothetical protein [Corallococcus macrosporus]